MNSFIGISNAHTTNLAVVAPGIAEALLATPLGLTAAIPAVVIYNMFARLIAGYRAGLGDAAAEVLRLVSRDLERAAAVPAERPPREPVIARRVRLADAGAAPRELSGDFIQGSIRRPPVFVDRKTSWLRSAPPQSRGK
jgi:MotA/TolQ/ExbB proton channel family